MITFAMSDIHGCAAAFDEALGLVDLDDPAVRLVLCGDYIDARHEHPEFYSSIKALQDGYPDQVVVLKGNHEMGYLLELELGILESPSAELAAWLEALPCCFETPDQIFVHAGVEEEAGDLWRIASDDYVLTGQFPPAFGSFCKDVVAGHVGTIGMCGEPRVYWDGASHYYLDGSTEETGVLPVLKFDDVTHAYTTFERTDSGAWREVPVRRPAERDLASP